MPSSRSSTELKWSPIEGRVALVAPASAIAEEVLEATLRQLEVLGVDYHLGEHADARYRYLAGTPQQRLEDFHAAFERDDISAVWCLRGGYGCGQLIPQLDWKRLQAASPRPLIGFSDISILLSAFHRHGLPAIHGPVATALGLQPLSAPSEQRERLASLASVSHVLAGNPGKLAVQHLAGPKQAVAGQLIGGNLTALACMAGTEGALYVPDGAILILEDVGEPYYRLERSLWQLLNSLGGARLGAVCLGGFTDCPRKGVAHSLEEIISEYVSALGVPLYHGLPSGHGAHNRAWPYGRQALLEGKALRWD
ncbi:LD-carboxypeptidase [Pseudomonas sp. SCB32]|uniref:S66 peptidase family protein n=1 Tax=Pseudomonas sp. SCB32 TaxID=2653853 RepID=UPI0012648D44|nr:LD-carboxypeptidase [Pseudomonas sp. SCB32]